MNCGVIAGLAVVAGVVALVVKVRCRSVKPSKPAPSLESSNNAPAVPAMDTMPNGKYVVRFGCEKMVNERLLVAFLITVGPHQGKGVVMVLDNQKVKAAFRERSGGWIPWLQSEGDPKASAIDHAILQSVAGQFLVTVKDGWVRTVHDPNESSDQIVRQFSKEWDVTPGEDGWLETFAVCKKFYLQMDRLPAMDGEYAREHPLARWLKAAVDEGGPAYRPEVRAWYNSIHFKLSEEFNAKNQGQGGGSMKNWLGNHGFEVK